MTTVSSVSTPLVREAVLLPQFTQDVSIRASGWFLSASGLDPQTWFAEVPPDFLRPISMGGLTAPMPISSPAETYQARSTPYQPRTPLGRRLWEIRAQIVASGERLLSWEEVEQELAERRGENEGGGHDETGLY